MKSDPTWREGTAVYYAFNFDQLVLPLGKALLAWPELLRQLTFLTVGLEGAGPWLALIPFWNGRIRTLMVFAFIAFHFTLGLCLSLGIFPVVCGVAWLQFLPSEFWEYVQRRWARANPAWRLQLATIRDRFAALAHRLPTADSHIFGVNAAGPRFRALVFRATEVVALFFLVYVFLWNLRSLNYARYLRVLPPSTDWIADATRLDQVWNMFAPPPQSNDGWFVIPAKLSNGVEVDLFRDGMPLTWQKPPLVVATSKGERWQKYMMNLTISSNVDHRAFYADYLRRDWDSRHPEFLHISSLQIFYMREATLLDNKVARPRKKYLGTYRF